MEVFLIFCKASKTRINSKDYYYASASDNVDRDISNEITYITDSPFELLLTYEECVAGLPEIWAYVSAFTKDNIVIVYVFYTLTATVTLTTHYRDITYDV